MNFSKKDRNEYTLFSYSFSSAHLVFFLGEKRETRLVLCPEVDTARPVEMALRKIFECEYNRCPVSPLFHPPFSFYQGPARKYNSETVSTIARLRSSLYHRPFYPLCKSMQNSAGELESVDLHTQKTRCRIRLSVRGTFAVLLSDLPSIYLVGRLPLSLSLPLLAPSFQNSIQE